MSNQVSDLNADQNYISFSSKSCTGNNPETGKVTASQNLSMTQNFKLHTNSFQTQNFTNAISNSLVSLDWQNQNEVPRRATQQLQQPIAIRSPGKFTIKKEITSPGKAVRLKCSSVKSPAKSPVKSQRASEHTEIPEPTPSQILVQMEMQIRKQQLQLQMKHNHFERVQELPQYSASRHNNASKLQDSELVPVAITFETQNTFSDNLGIKNNEGTSIQNRAIRDNLEESESIYRRMSLNPPANQMLQHYNTNDIEANQDYAHKVIPFGDTSNSPWQNYSEFQQQHHMNFATSANIRTSVASHYQTTEKEDTGHQGSGSEMPDSKQNQSLNAKGKEKDKLVRQSKSGGPQGPNINLTVTNSRRVISNAPIKQKVKAGQKIKRAGTMAEGSQSITRTQKVASFQNRSQIKQQSIVIPPTGKKQKENKQASGMEPTTYQAIKNMMTSKQQQQTIQAQKMQPQIQIQQQNSGQKQRPKSSNPTSSAIVKRRTILNGREESNQINLQNQQTTQQKSGGTRHYPESNLNDFSGTNQDNSSIQASKQDKQSAHPRPGTGVHTTQSRSKTNLVSSNVPLCITGSLMHQQSLNQPQIIGQSTMPSSNPNFQGYMNSQVHSLSKEDIHSISNSGYNSSFFLKRNNRDGAQRETIENEHSQLAVIDFNPSQKQKVVSGKPSTMNTQLDATFPTKQSFTAKTKAQGGKIEMVSSEYKQRKLEQQTGQQIESLPIHQRPQSSTFQQSNHKQTASMIVTHNGPQHRMSFIVSDAESDNQNSSNMVKNIKRSLAHNDSTVICEGMSRSGQYSNSLTQQSMTKSVHSDKEAESLPSKQLPPKHNLISTSSPGSKPPSTKNRKNDRPPTHQAISTHQMQMLPSTPKTFKRTKRVHFARRMSHMDRPLIVINFQGVIGDFIKLPAFKDKISNKLKPQHRLVETTKEEKAVEVELNSTWRGLNLRLGALEGLKYLSQQYQLVVFSRESIEESWFEQGGQVPSQGEQTKIVMNLLLATPDIKLDGFYTSTLPNKNQNMCDDYAQIFLDFGMNSEKKVCEKVLFVNSIGNDFVSNLASNTRKASKDIDDKGYFMFDFSCQPAQPLVRGLPISLEVKSETMNNKSHYETGAGDNSKTPTKREMPVTLLVPNVRSQTMKIALNFSQIVKSIMLMAYLGQKKNTSKSLKEVNKDSQSSNQQLFYNSAIQVKPLFEQIDEGNTIKERFITLKPKVMRIVQQPTRSSPEKEKIDQMLPIDKKFQQDKRLDKFRKEKTQRMLRDTVGQSPSGSVNSHMSGGQNSSLSTQSNLHNRTHHGYGRSASTNSEKLRSGLGSHSENLDNTLQHDSHLNNGREESPGLGSFFQTESHSNLNTTCEQPRKTTPKEVNIDLTDQFYQNLSWSQGSDFLNEKAPQVQRNYLGFRTAHSDTVWRFYSKQIRENMQIKALYEQRMDKIENLVKKTLSNDTIVANREKNIDAVFEILRCGNLTGNPLGMTMGRNYRFFTNIYVQMRSKLAKELRTWQELNEASQNLGGDITPSDTTLQPKEVESPAQTIEDRRAFRHQQTHRIGSILNNSVSGGKAPQRSLAGQDLTKIEELLERNNLYNRIVTVGLDAPQLYFSFAGSKYKVLEQYNPQATYNHQNFSTNFQSNNNQPAEKPQERTERARSLKSHSNVGSVQQQPAPMPQLQATPINIGPFEAVQHKQKQQLRQQHHLSKQPRNVAHSIEGLMAPVNTMPTHMLAPNSAQPLIKLSGNLHPNQQRQYIMQTSLPVETSPMTNTMYTVNSHLRQGMAAGGQDYPNSMGLGGFGSSYAFTN